MLVALVLRAVRSLAGRDSLRGPAPLCAACFAAGVSVMVLVGCSASLDPALTREGAAPSASTGLEVTIARVIDGDTVEISPSVDGVEDVRLIGMDTPEVSGECGPEPLAGAAERYTRRYTGERVSLEFDEERIDRYGRLLAYVHVSGQPGSGMLNERLVREGLAQVATFQPNTRYEERFLDVQARAREESAGIWGLDDAEKDLLANRGNGIGGGGC